MAKHEKAFDKGTDADKLAATSEQYQEQTGQKDAPEAGPDPIIEAGDKAVADLNLEETPVEDTTYVSQGTVIEESDKADEVPIEGAVSEEDKDS